MQRLERVVNLLAALIDTERPLTRDEIQRRVPGYEGEPASARRSFERDKQLLRDMGLPLATEALDPDHPEDGTGYRIPKDDYQLPDPQLTPEETAALGVAASAVRLKSQSASAALLKLGATPEVEASSDVDIAGEEVLTTLFTARRERRTVTFQYKGSLRTFDPHNLSFRNGRWYVAGYDHKHDQARTYRLDRIESDVQLTSETFASPQSASTEFPYAWELGESQPVDIRVLIDADHADLALAQTPKRAFESRTGEGAVILKLTTTNWDALRSFVLGFLDHAEIIDPPEFRERFSSYVRQMV